MEPHFLEANLHCNFRRSDKVYFTSAMYDRHGERVPFYPRSLIVKLNIS
jgi:hypothetical protein